MKKQAGFTLIELVVVIVILGILAAYAIPKYMSIDKEARAAVTKGLEGSLRAASDMVHALAIAQGKSGAGNVTIDSSGAIVAVSSNLYPAASATGIQASLSDYSGFGVASANNVTTFTKTGATTAANCSVSYDNTGNLPVITLLTDGC